MKLIGVLVMMAVSVGISSPRAAQPAAPRGTLEGTWQGEVRRDEALSAEGVRLSLQLMPGRDRDRGWGTMGFTLPLSALLGLPADPFTIDTARFELQRDAGVTRFEGSFRGGRGAGYFTFTPIAEYVAFLTTRGERDVPVRRLLGLAIHDVSRSFIAEIERRGYKALTISKLEEMRIHRVTPEFIDELQKEGYTQVSIDRLIEMRIHRVTPETIKEFKALGYNDLTTSRLVEMRIHRVTPEFVRELQGLGYKDIPARKLVEMRIHRVDADFIKTARDEGYKDLSVDDLIELSIHGRRWMARKRR